MQRTFEFNPNPMLKKYFWDHTTQSSDIFKLRRLLEYASFPDLLKIPFTFLKSNIHGINANSLRTSETRRRFVKKIKEYIASSNDWDEIILKIAGLR